MVTPGMPQNIVLRKEGVGGHQLITLLQQLTSLDSLFISCFRCCSATLATDSAKWLSSCSFGAPMKFSKGGSQPFRKRGTQGGMKWSFGHSALCEKQIRNLCQRVQECWFNRVLINWNSLEFLLVQRRVQQFYQYIDRIYLFLVHLFIYVVQQFYYYTGRIMLEQRELQLLTSTILPAEGVCC